MASDTTRSSRSKAVEILCHIHEVSNVILVASHIFTRYLLRVAVTTVMYDDLYQLRESNILNACSALLEHTTHPGTMGTGNDDKRVFCSLRRRSSQVRKPNTDKAAATRYHYCCKKILDRANEYRRTTGINCKAEYYKWTLGCARQYAVASDLASSGLLYKKEMEETDHRNTSDTIFVERSPLVSMNCLYRYFAWSGNAFNRRRKNMKHAQS